MTQKSTVYITMGVSGCGKSLIGQKLAAVLNIPFYDGDDFHPIRNVKKMEGGTPLNDSDRKPWLENLNAQIQQWNLENGAVLACSALKESYRQLLSTNAEVVFIHLHATKAQILERMNNRKDHFMPSTLLDSQFATLETPKTAISVDVSASPDEIIEYIKANI